MLHNTLPCIPGTHKHYNTLLLFLPCILFPGRSHTIQADTNSSLGDALRQLVKQLQSAWATCHGPCAFAEGPLGDTLRLVRAGGACSTFRGATPAELVRMGGPVSEGGALGGGLGGALSAVGEQLLEVLQVYRGLAGCWTLLAVQVLKAGVMWCMGVVCAWMCDWLQGLLVLVLVLALVLVFGMLHRY